MQGLLAVGPSHLILLWFFVLKARMIFLTVYRESWDKKKEMAKRTLWNLLFFRFTWTKVLFFFLNARQNGHSLYDQLIWKCPIQVNWCSQRLSREHGWQLLMGMGFPLHVMKIFWRWIMVRVAHIWEYTENHWALYFTWVNYSHMNYNLHLIL